MGPGHGRTYCDHNGVPGGREDVRVVVPQVMLLQLLGEKLSGQLKSTGRWKCNTNTFPKRFPKFPSANGGGCLVGLVLFFFFFCKPQRGNMGKATG